MLTLSGLTGLSIVLLTVVGYRFDLGILARGSILFSLMLFGVAGAAAAGNRWPQVALMKVKTPISARQVEIM